MTLNDIHRTTYNEKTGFLAIDESYIARSVIAFVDTMKLSGDSSVFKPENRNDEPMINASFLLDNFMKYLECVAESRWIDDSDVTRFIGDLVKLVNIDIDVLLEKDNLNLVEFYLYLCFIGKTSMITSADGTVSQMLSYSFERSMFGVSLAVRTRRGVMVGDTVNWLVSNIRVSSNKISTSALPIKVANEEEISSAYLEGKARLSSYTPVGYKQYSGIAYYPGFMGVAAESFLENCRVITDSYALKRENYSHLSAMYGILGGSLDNDHAMDYKELLESDDRNIIATLCSEVVMFDLERKRWYLGLEENISDVNLRSDALSKLIMDDSKKEMIKAIATEHRVSNSDIIDGKGSNAIFLLYGDPGTGKTLTAEAVAEYMAKPLYKVSLGELGTDVCDLEEELQRILNLCERWDCIMLIDEADIFLERRDTSNLERNAMVAVFLRMLEYYEGILFLTTNRVKQFDVAFVSRISLAIHYKRPDMVSLWSMLLLNSHIEHTDSDIDDLSAYGVNGRQAKMAINTAKAVAAYNKVEVTTDHVRDSLTETQAFQDFLDM